MIQVINSLHTPFIYLAYNSIDDADVDRMFKANFANNSFSVWHRMGCMGNAYAEAEQCLDSSNCIAVIVVLSSNSYKDLDVIADLVTARKKGHPVFPVKIDDFAETPELRTFLLGLTAITVTNRNQFAETGRNICERIRGMSQITLVGGDGTPYCFPVNSKSIALPNTGIVDIRPLADCRELTSLALYQNSISDISALAGLEALEDLNLRDNQIDNIDALRNHPNLRVLTLGENAISDVSPLTSLHNLTTLYLNENRLQNNAVIPLSRLTSLRFLSIKSNPIADPSPLTALSKSLEHLIISSSGVSAEAKRKIDSSFGAKVEWK